MSFADNLTGATTKSLMRLRRDQLVQLCQDRDIEPEGTKPQLTEALLKWRSQQEATSPSSTCTVRPGPSVRELAGSRRKSSRNSQTRTPVPVLLRSHIHVHQPSTPPVSAPDTIKEGTKEGEDGELELDLSSLGLEEREIPCDKLLKLEKIGSGGFKDVFIGKWKNRKVAISEFRGSLTASEFRSIITIEKGLTCFQWTLRSSNFLEASTIPTLFAFWVSASLRIRRRRQS
jgi:mitogen-activated protein kinase kinase kinase 13